MDATRFPLSSFEPEPDAAARLMEQCLQLPAAQQEATLEKLCAAHPELAATLRGRWAALQALGLPSAPGDEAPFPERLGDFRLLERLGGGGMGVVYRAEQLSLGRQVALKLMRPEQMFFPSARERFRREIEAIASLQHPGIVPVYACGEEAGVPYFAMELVPGRTLSAILKGLAGRAPESLAGADLAASFSGTWVEACLQVCRQVAGALEHAHGRGVLHRDVKPSNVILTRDGRALLFDFGLTGSDRPDQRLTGSGTQLGTLPYMSPEQLRDARSLTAQTDVYSLGVTFYELLTLQLPYQGEDRAEIERRILGGRPDSIRARNRRVPADAETVCLTAMAPEAARRYPSAAAFGRDLGNVLERRPIAARPPSGWVKARRLVQRRPAQTLAAALAVLLATGLPTGLLLQQRASNRKIQDALAREIRQRDTAQARADQYQVISQFLLELFAASDPDETRGEEVTARELIARGKERIRFDLYDQPQVRSALLLTLGAIDLKLGNVTTAAELLETALAQIRALDPLDVELLLRGSDDLAEAYSALGKREQAESLLAEAERTVGRTYGKKSIEWLSVRNRRGSYLATHLRFDEAESVYQDIQKALSDVPDLAPLEKATLLDGVGSFLLGRAQNLPRAQRAGLFEEALVYLQQAWELTAGSPQVSTHQLAKRANLLALCLRHLGRFDQASSLYDQAAAAYRKIQGDQGLQVGIVLANQSGMLDGQGRYAAAAPLIREAVAILETHLPEESQTMVLARANLSGTLSRAGLHQEAAELYREVLPRQRRHFPEDHPSTYISLQNLGTCLRMQGDYAGAETLLREALESCGRRNGGLEHPETCSVRIDFVELYLDAGRVDEARRELEKLQRILDEHSGYAADRRYLSLLRGRLAAAEGRLEDAVRTMGEAERVFETEEPEQTNRWLAGYHRSEYLAALGRKQEALALLQELRKHSQGRLAAESTQLKKAAALEQKCLEGS